VARGLVALTGAKVTGAPPKGGTDVLSWRVLSRVFLELVDSVSPGEAGRKRPRRPRVAVAASGLGIVARGVESFTLDLGRALATGFDVSVYGGGRSGAGHKVIPCVGRNNAVARACMAWLPGSARRVIRRLRLDPLGLEKLTFSLGLTLALLARRQDVLVQSDGWWGGLFSRVARKLTGVRVITVGHGGLGGALEEIAQSTDCYINVNFTIVDELARRWPGKRIVSLPLFVDTSRYAPGASPLALSLPRPVFLTVGALEEEKRIDLAVKALGKLGEGSLLIVGSGRMEHDLRQLCMRILGEGRFHITRASRDEMVHYYAYADVFTLPSPREAFSLSVLEALACDLPVVTVKEGTRSTLGNGCIVACDPLDAVAYAAALRKATGMAGSGRSRQRALRYSSETAASAWGELILEVCGK
jgi:glycosyltransferase involved in cell wall biosynthesis